MSPDTLLDQDFGLIADLVHAYAQERPHHPAVVQEGRVLAYGALDTLMDRVAASLQRDAVQPGEVIAICAASSMEYAAIFLGALRAGVAVAPLAPSSTPQALATMLADCRARIFFLDGAVAAALARQDLPADLRRVAVEESAQSSGVQALREWLAAADAKPRSVHIDPAAPFNIIYSSGTTGTPKGIVQSHRMRWAHVHRASTAGYDRTAVTICSTPLYSNTTLVSFFPTLARGGTVVLMAKFDAVKFLELAQQYRATHAMLVPVQYRRIMELPDFDRYDLRSFRMKFCTSAPFAAALKADILKRWPGGLTEYYGMTEGGGSCILKAHEFPDKLHTVGQPAPGHEIRLIDEQGREVARGEIGEVVGRSPASMMNGYFNQPAKTAEAQWHDTEGNRYIRTGDVGRFDEQGFLTLLDRRKDMIISGGFNIYPSDLESVLSAHEAIQEVAVVGVPSTEWGETPVAFVVLKAGRADAAEAIRTWANQRLGRTQRLAAVQISEALPRSAIGKVLKRELRERYRSPLE
jgi:long-chain acyl-CoA synthetase